MTRIWTSPPPELQLQEDCIDVWRVPLDLPDAECAALQSLLTATEFERAMRYLPREKFREFIITRATLRLVLGRLLDRDPAAMVIECAAHDKPHTPDTFHGRSVTFNVSHTRGQSLIAVTLDRPLGIDIERVRFDVEFRKLARRFFSEPEAAALERVDDAALPRAFFTVWTRKEAFVKAVGRGIAFGLAGFSVSTDPHQGRVDLSIPGDPEAAAGWILAGIDTGTDYCAALAVRGPDPDIRYWNTPGVF